MAEESTNNQVKSEKIEPEDVDEKADPNEILTITKVPSKIVSRYLGAPNDKEIRKQFQKPPLTPKAEKPNCPVDIKEVVVTNENKVTSEKDSPPWKKKKFHGT
ncbi:hypothetical protein SESBI_02671 [Sesbania bispinosa]|nr:hypothetical protein SESBI_02671 [Sesbania bispinosa]